MRIRKPPMEKPESTIKLGEERWRQFEVELITPMFGGGVSAGCPDGDMPIRVAAIRGQLRYWWRFLNRDAFRDSERLFENERRIWGGTSEDDTDFTSKVRIKIENVSHPELVKYKGIASYALFPARGTQENPEYKDLIRAGLTFNLKVFCPDKQYYSDHVEPALRWWATFGGLGARTRRGVGSVSITDLVPISKEEATINGCQLVLGKKQHSNPISAWKNAVDLMQRFRQGASIGRNHKKDDEGTKLYYDEKKTNPKLGRSFWPEPDSIREITETHAYNHKPNHLARISFPRAAFGLPIIFKFKDDNAGDPEQTELTPDGAERLSSPLILTSYPIGNEKYSSAALLLPTDHIKSMGLQLCYTNSENTMPSPDEQIDENHTNDSSHCAAPTRWWNEGCANNVPPINNNAGTDALSAFMNFFKNGGQSNE